MSENSSPVLTPAQWESRDYRQAAGELDAWAKARAGTAPADDSTEYVAKLGLDESGSVIVMNRAHDRVLVPPPARPVLAAFALVDQPCGFTATDVDALERAAASTGDEALASALRNLGSRLQALLPSAA
jgi:hypothetical protein